MSTSKNLNLQSSALNDLIKTNNDRITGYKRAAENITDSNLKIVFQRMADQSAAYSHDLERKVNSLGIVKPEEGTTLAGKFYHAWMDVKSEFTGKSRHSVLSDCEYGEDTALRAYNEVLGEKSLDLNHAADLTSLLEKQRNGLQQAHGEIKRLRDMQSN